MSKWDPAEDARQRELAAEFAAVVDGMFSTMPVTAVEPADTGMTADEIEAAIRRDQP